MNLLICPRCGERAYECLETYGYCIGCNFSPTLDGHYEPAFPEWALKALLNEYEVDSQEEVKFRPTKWVSSKPFSEIKTPA